MSTDLVKACAQLARSAPRSWDDFLAAYRAYSIEVTNQMVSSPADTLHVAQGRAKQAHELLRIMENALRTAEQLERK